MKSRLVPNRWQDACFKNNKGWTTYCPPFKKKRLKHMGLPQTHAFGLFFLSFDFLLISSFNIKFLFFNLILNIWFILNWFLYFYLSCNKKKLNLMEFVTLVIDLTGYLKWTRVVFFFLDMPSQHDLIRTTLVTPWNLTTLHDTLNLKLNEKQGNLFTHTHTHIAHRTV